MELLLIVIALALIAGVGSWRNHRKPTNELTDVTQYGDQVDHHHHHHDVDIGGHHH